MVKSLTATDVVVLLLSSRATLWVSQVTGVKDVMLVSSSAQHNVSMRYSREMIAPD